MADTERLGSCSARSAHRLGMLAGAVTLVVAMTPAPVAARTPSVLLLAADPGLSPGLALALTGMRREIAEGYSPDVELHLEHLDLVYMTSPEFRRKIAQLLSEKYSDRAPDVIVTIGRGASSFALEQRSHLFPEARLLLDASPYELDPRTLPTDVAAVVNSYDLAGELTLALRLFPQAKRAVVILGSGPQEQRIEPVGRRELATFAPRITVDWWIGVPLAELERDLARLDRHTIVLYVGVYRDRDGAALVPAAVMERIGPLSAAPIFTVSAGQMGFGAVGDGRYDVRALGAALGRQTTRLLHGESPESVGQVTVEHPQLVFDARALDRWGISRRLLPAGSKVEFETSAWRLYRGWILLGATVVALETALLLALAAEMVRRRRAERLQRRDASRSATLFASLQERVLILGRAGEVLAANEAWGKAGGPGTPLDARPGENLLSRLRDGGDEDGRAMHDSVHAVLSGERAESRLDYLAHGKEGELRCYEVNVVALQGDEPGAVLAIEDVTDHRRAEERLRTAIESLPVPALITGENGEIEQLNVEAERFLGYRRAELVGSPIDRVAPGFREHADRMLRSWLGHAETQMLVTDPELAAVRKDGSTVGVQARIRRLQFGDRSLLLGSLTDLTQRRRLESEMQLLRVETAHFARIATVGEMSAAITHELNQPLTGILTNSQAALRFLDSGRATPDDLREALADVVADSRRAGEVIERLRSLLRKGPVEIRPIDVNQIVRQVARLVAPDLHLRDAALDLELAPDLPLVAGDRVHLQQVVLNLVLNGGDAMIDTPPDERRLLVRTAPGIGRTVDISVRDAGTGIPPDSMSRLFEPFFTTKPSGMGMGLSIVRSIVDAHGGRIAVSNNGSGGATFTITLPAAATAKEAA